MAYLLYNQGTYENGKDRDCVQCETGKVQPREGQQSCIDCPDGEFPNKDRTQCVKCEKVV